MSINSSKETGLLIWLYFGPLGRIIAEIIVLLADSSALPMTLHDYVKDIRKEFDHFMAEYHDDFQKANLSYGMWAETKILHGENECLRLLYWSHSPLIIFAAQLQSAVRRLEITAENFKTQGKNHSKNNEDSGEFHHRKLRYVKCMGSETKGIKARMSLSHYPFGTFTLLYSKERNGAPDS